jgi:hypothetical protein
MVMTTLLTTDRYRRLARVPTDWIDALAGDDPQWVDAQLELESAYVSSLLGKRYDVSKLAGSVAAQRWVAALVDEAVQMRRGFDATDQSAATYTEHANRAREDLLKAASAVDGLFDLVLLDGTGISKGGMISYCETSPFLGARIQRTKGRQEDRQGRGTTMGRK